MTSSTASLELEWIKNIVVDDPFSVTLTGEASLEG
jgi:hypothetical protein